MIRALCEKLADGYGSWGSGPWYCWDEAVRVSKEQKKPIMVIVDDETCMRCNLLQEEMGNCPAMTGMLCRFVKVLYRKEHAPKMLAPDGDYVPRILFADSNGQLLPVVNIHNMGDKQKYLYNNVRSLGISMENALRSYKAPSG